MTQGDRSDAGDRRLRHRLLVAELSQRLPIDYAEDRRAFVGDLTTDPDDEAITATIIAMAHSLGLNVVAEASKRRTVRIHCTCAAVTKSRASGSPRRSNRGLPGLPGPAPAAAVHNTAPA
jgi:predicted signal transduction protein with EAL and GGDEF domain